MSSQQVDIVRHQRRLSALVVTLVGVVCLATAVALSPCAAQGGRLGDYQITAVASPPSVPADGKSAARIRIGVYDTNGRAAPDGTSVVVSTNLGRLSETGFGGGRALTVKTASGFASVFASSNTPGSATIRVEVGASLGIARVRFRAEGEEAAPAARAIHISGGWVGYAVEMNVIEARDAARVVYGELEVSGADLLQLDANKMELRAEPAVVTRADKELLGERLVFQFYSKRGALQRFTDEGSIEKVSFDADSMETCELDANLPGNMFDFLDVDAHTWLIADAITVFVGEKIVFRNAEIYVDGRKVMNLAPYWILAMPGYTGASHSHIVGVNSDGGLAVNFPFFYRVTDKATGALEIQRAAQSGSVIAREGWSLGLREEYRGNEIEGQLALAGLPRSDWGVEWRDTRAVFGGVRGDFSVGWPDHHSLFADANLFDFRGSYRYNLRGYYRRPRDSDSRYGLTSDWLTSPRRLPTGRDDSYRLGISLGTRHDSWEKSGLVFDNELYGRFDFGAWRLGPQTWLAFDIDNRYSWNTAQYSANSARAGLTLEKKFGDGVTTFLDYSAEYGTGDAYRDGWWQVLDMNTWADLGRWHAYFMGSWDLTDDGILAYLDLIYYLNDSWRVVALGTHYQYEDTSFDDIELGVGWRVWQDREIGLRWSRDTGRVALELADLTSPF